MMNREQQLFLQILSDFLNEKTTESDYDIDWNILNSYAKKHQVEAIIYYQCKSFMPKELAYKSAQTYASQLYYFTNRSTMFDEIGDRLSNDGIAYYTVKGLNVAECYPIPAFRTMGDCDIVVHTADKKKTHEIMLSLGYQNHSKQDAEWTYFKNHLEFEIHDHLLYDEVVNSALSRDFTDEAWYHATRVGEGSLYELDWNFHFIFLMLHLKKHFLNSGVGFRQFMDLVVVIEKKELDWEMLKDNLSKLDLLEFTKVCLSLCEQWFKVKMPVIVNLDENFYENATQKIFSNGVFGFDDEQNRQNSNLNALHKYGKLRMILGSIFPAYKNVKYVPHYSFVKGRPWLLPLVWVYRPYRSLKHGKGADGVKMLNRAVTSDEAMDQRRGMLEQWGL